MHRLIGTGILVVGLLLASGCDSGGPSLGKVTGKVTLDGKPLPNAAVTFMPIGGGSGSATGRTDESGTYTLHYQDREGAPIGKHKVAVTSIQQAKETVDLSQIPSDSPEYAKAIAAQGSADYNVKFTEPIPAKYNTQTTLEYEVKSGANDIPLDLKTS